MHVPLSSQAKKDQSNYYEEIGKPTSCILLLYLQACMRASLSCHTKLEYTKENASTKGIEGESTCAYSWVMFSLPPALARGTALQCSDWILLL